MSKKKNLVGCSGKDCSKCNFMKKMKKEVGDYSATQILEDSLSQSKGDNNARR